MKTKGKIITLTMLTAATTGAIYVLNKARELADTAESIFSGIDGEYYNWRFGKVFYTKQGSGKPILLIHDLNATSSHYEWMNIVNDLSKTNTVYAIDLLGCGNSDKPNLTYTNFLYVQLINDFIKNVIEEKADIIATSESSAIAIMACTNNAELIDRIVLVNPVSPISLAKNPTKRSTIVRDLINLPIVGTMLYNILIRRTTVENDFRTKYYYNPDNITDKLISTYLESSHIGESHSKYLYASIVSKYTNTNIMQSLNNMNNSIYIIVGNGNPENVLAADQYQNQVPAIEIVSMENSKLLPQLELPKKFMEQLNIFLESK
ncbi:MAG: alpha/beta fold hydrolase [Hespellia sp.]|nr:alpha/beta fold hydrolase [Hespellia sp.]